MIAAAGIAVERIDVSVRARHALSRPDPHGGGAAAGDAAGRHAASARRSSARPSRRPISASFSRLLPGHCRCASCRCASPRSAAARRSTSRCSRPGRRRRSRRRGAARGRSGSTAAGATPRSGRGSICRPARRIDGAGHPGAARRHHRDRAGPARPGRRARQSDRGARRDESSQPALLILGDLQNDFLHPRRRLWPRRAGAAPAIAALPARLAPLADAPRAAAAC